MSTVTIRPVDPRGNAITVELYGTEERTGGVGGWSELIRPRRTPATEWNSTPIVTIVLPLILDGLGAGPGGRHVSVEPQVRALKLLGKKAAAVGRPPILTLAGPIDTTARDRWVLNDLVPGATIRNDAQQRIQVQLSATFLQYDEAQVVRGPARRWQDSRR